MCGGKGVEREDRGKRGKRTEKGQLLRYGHFGVRDE